MNKQRRIASGDGFTLVEVVIAMAIFSFMLLIMTAAILGLFRIYEAGAQIRNTQKNARLVSESVSSDIRTALAVYTTPVTSSAGYRTDTICLFNIVGSSTVPAGSGTVYYVVPVSGRNELHKKDFVAMPTNKCLTMPTPAYPSLSFSSTDEIVTDDGVSLEIFGVASGGDPSYVSIDLSFVPTAALAGGLVSETPPANPICREDQPGSQYCAITNLTVGGTTHVEREN